MAKSADPATSICLVTATQYNILLHTYEHMLIMSYILSVCFPLGLPVNIYRERHGCRRSNSDNADAIDYVFKESKHDSRTEKSEILVQNVELIRCD